MTRLIRPPSYGDAAGDDGTRGADRPTVNRPDHLGCSTSQDLKDTVAVAILVHGLPAVQRALDHYRRRLQQDPATALDDPRRKRKPRRPWNEPPYPTPEEETCR